MDRQWRAPRRARRARHRAAALGVRPRPSSARQPLALGLRYRLAQLARGVDPEPHGLVHVPQRASSWLSPWAMQPGSSGTHLRDDDRIRVAPAQDDLVLVHRRLRYRWASRRQPPEPPRRASVLRYRRIVREYGRACRDPYSAHAPAIGLVAPDAMREIVLAPHRTRVLVAHARHSALSSLEIHGSFNILLNKIVQNDILQTWRSFIALKSRRC